MRGMILGSMDCGVWAAFRRGGVGRIRRPVLPVSGSLAGVGLILAPASVELGF
jgi:hypothetical protein